METQHLSLGMTAPDFTAQSTQGVLKLSDYKGKWVVLFSHPGDFTPVCTTEFIAFAKANEQFAARSAQLIGLSIDSNPSHIAWLMGIEITTGIQVPFPVIADRMGEIASMYGMLAPDISTQETVRNVFILDPEQKIRAILTYPMSNGRNIDEILRLLTALQTTDQHKISTPANWRPGDPVILPPPQTYQEAMIRREKAKNGTLNCQDWFLCFKSLPHSK